MMPANVTRMMILILMVYACVECQNTIRLVTAQAPPFVIYDGTNLTGFTIDLWNAIFELSVFDPPVTGFNWTVLPTSVASIVPYLTNNLQTADIGISDISITSARQNLVDFSPSMFPSGLSILVPFSVPKPIDPSTALVANMFSKLFWQELGILLLGVFIASQIYFCLERKKKGEEAVVRPNYQRGGLEDSIWWSGQILLSGGADVMPMTLGGRILNLVAFLFALVLMSIIGGTITASLTVSSLASPTGIQSLRDLQGHQVGVVNQSTADLFMQSLGGSFIVRFPNSSAMLQAFIAPEAPMDAVLYDYPILEYFSRNLGAGKCKLVGSVFAQQDYGIAFPHNSPYIVPVDVALLKLQESGDYDTIYADWFTTSSSSAESTAEVIAPQADTILLGVTYGVAGFLFLATAAVFVWNARRRQKRIKSVQLENFSVPQLTPRESASRLVSDIKKIKEALDGIEEVVAQKYEIV